jgi:hypothetical protein
MYVYNPIEAISMYAYALVHDSPTLKKKKKKKDKIFLNILFHVYTEL